MNEKVVSAALEEIMEDKWIPNYCTKEPAFQSRTLACQKGSKGALHPAAKKRHHKEDTDTASKRLKVGSGKTQLNAVKKKGKKGSRTLNETSSKPLRRSFWQLDRIPENVAIAYGEHRRTTRLSEKNPPKRRIRRPKWLLEDSGTLEENNVLPKFKNNGLKHQKHHRSSIVKRAESGQIKNNIKYKPSVNSHLKARENNNHQKGFSLDCVKPATPPQVILELSLPDNELMGTFTEDTCNRQRGFPQVLLYKPTVKLPATSQPVKTVHGKEVVLRARDETMFVLQLHCYARQQKGKGKGLNVQGSVSTITRSSVQGSPPKEPPREFCEKPDAEMKGGIVSQTPVAPDVAESRDLEKVLQGQTTKAGSRKTSSAREHSEKVDAKMRTTTASQTSAAAEVTEDSMLHKVPQAQTTASVGELCEEPAVEMKVTIASQTPTVVKVTQTPNLDKVSKVPAVEDISKITASPKVVWTTTADDNQVEITDKITLVSNIANMSNIGPSHPVPSQSQDTALRDGDQELKSFSCNSIAKADVLVGSPKDSSGHVLCENDTCLGGSVVTLTKTLETQAIDQDSINDISALTLVTEMVTELAPKELAQELENDKPQTPVSSSFKESKAGSKPKVPHKTSSITNWPVPEQEASTVADVQGKKGKGRTLDNALEIPEDSEPMETTPESEESKLEYCCTFCSKVFKGSRVVAHAMFHYRRDECMFCGTVFKDDLLAMMHLSDHIEKLKKSKDLVGNKAQQNQVCETKDISTPKTSAKAKDINVSSGHRSSGRLKKSPVCSKSVSLPDSSASESRKLRSNDKPVDGQLLQEKKQNTLKHLNGETPVHKVNGHIDKKREIRHVSKEQELDKAKKNLQAKQPLTQQKIPQQRASNGYKNPELPENHDMAVDFSTSSAQVEKDFGCSSENKMRETESLQVLKTATKQNEKNVEPQEKLCCPVDGCAWFTDVSKKRVALLYHALEDHCGEVKPLELAFRVGNSKCSICMRVLWSFEHFLHHVERHRLSPRHPCLHQGCTARFKTGMEMRRHARRHSPLQAVCCHPGCSQLFICLWALNLHEREHYASKSAKPDKNLNMQTGDKQLKTETGEKQQDKSNDATAVHKAVSVKVAHNRQQATHNSSSRNHKAPITTVRTTLLKQELMERNETKESNILKNLSDKDASAQPTVPNLRLRQTLKVTNATTSAPKSKVISLLLKHKSKLRYKFKKKQVKVNAKCPKRRGRPPKSNKAVQGENTAGQKNETIKTAVQKDQKSPAQLSSSLKAAETSNLSNKLKEDERKHVVKATETSTDVSKSQKLKKLSKLKKRSTCQTASDSSKSKNSKATISKTNTNKVKKKGPVKEPKSALKKPIQSESVGEAKATDAIVKTSDEVGKAQVENTNSTQSNPENPVPAVTADSLNEKTAPPTTSGETTQKLTTEEKSKKSHIAKKEVKKERNTPSACSGKATKNYKDGNKEGDKSPVVEKQPCKDRCNKSVTKKTMANSEVQQQVEATATLEKTLDEVGKGKVEASDATLDNTDPSMTAVTNSVNEKTAATADHTQKITEKKSKKSGAMKNSANQKRKNIHKESDTKRVKKKSLDLSLSEESKTLPQTLQSTISGPGYSLVMNGQEVNEDLKSTVCTGILAKYSKRPYMRLPPTAYLAEKYITMPKRRKDISFFPCSQKSPPPEQTTVTTALQRQRCANCFATFNSSEELQSHLQAQKCSDLFGFDSDEEGESEAFVVQSVNNSVFGH